MASQLKDGQASPEQLFPAVEDPKEEPPKGEGKPGKTRTPKAGLSVPPSPPSSLLPRAATPDQLAEIRLGILEKGIDLELILKEWQVKSLEELDEESAGKVKEWLARQ
jgi:hypothetical protein